MLAASTPGSLAPTVVIDVPSSVFFGTLIGLFIAFAVATTAFLGWQFWKTFHPERSEAATDALAKRYNLTIAPENREALIRYLAVRTRSGLVGALAGMLAVIAIIRPFQYSPPEIRLAGGILLPTVTLSAVLMGTAIGGLLGRRAASGGHRTARLTDLTITDLLAPIERRVLGGCVLAGVIGAGTLAVALQAPWADPPPLINSDAMWLLVAAGAAVVGYALLPAAAVRLGRSRAITGDENALAWSDALAAHTLRDLMYLVGAVSGGTAMVSIMSLGLSLPDELRDAGNVWLNVAMYLAIGVLVVLIAIVSVREPSRHVQRTLWPQFARDAQ